MENLAWPRIISIEALLHVELGRGFAILIIFKHL
jgi:hypothetical protein